MVFSICEEQIASFLRSHPEGATIEDVARSLQISRNTAARYLDALLHAGRAEMRRLGPAHIYRFTGKIPLDEIINAFDSPILLLDENFQIHNINTRGEELIHAKPGSIKGRNLIHTPYGPISEEIKKNHKGSINTSFSLDFFNDEIKRKMFFRIICKAIILSEKESGYIVFLNDISEIIEQKELQEFLLDAWTAELTKIQNIHKKEILRIKSKNQDKFWNEQDITHFIQHVKPTLIRLDNDGLIKDLNIFATETIGIWKKDLIGKNPLNLFFSSTDVSGDLIITPYEEVLKGVTESFHWESGFPGSLNEKYVSWSLISIRNGKRSCEFLLSGSDITTQIQKRNGNTVSKNQISQILDHITEATYIFDRNFIITHWNRALEEITKIPSDSSIGKTVDEIRLMLIGDERSLFSDLIFQQKNSTSRDFFDRMEKEGTAFSTEAVIFHPDGTRNIYLIKATPFFDDDGNIEGAVQSIHHMDTIKVRDKL